MINDDDVDDHQERLHAYNDEEPLRYERPTRGILGWFTRRLPAQPEGQVHLDLEWRDVRANLGIEAVILSAAMLCLVIVGITIFFMVPFLHITLLGTIAGIVRILWHQDLHQGNFFPSGSIGAAADDGFGWPWYVRIVATFAVMALMKLFISIIPRAALDEEQLFREGAELWTWPERIKASFLFGFAHVSNLIYSVATMLALSGGGMIFTLYYLHSYHKTRDSRLATKRVAAVHSLYNMLAILLFALTLLVLIWS